MTGLGHNSDAALFDQQEREKELRDFDAVWPGDDPLSISSAFRQAYKDAIGREAPAVEFKDRVFTVHFRFAGVQKFTAKQMKVVTERCKTRRTLAVQP